MAKTGSYSDLSNKPTIPSIAGLATETYVDNAVATKANTADLGTAAATDATDYATAAQGAKADSAVQIETDPTVPSWAKTPSKPIS